MAARHEVQTRSVSRCCLLTIPVSNWPSLGASKLRGPFSLSVDTSFSPRPLLLCRIHLGYYQYSTLSAGRETFSASMCRDWSTVYDLVNNLTLLLRILLRLLQGIKYCFRLLK